MCNCVEPRVARIRGILSDRCSFQVPHLNLSRAGFVPRGLGIGEGGHLELELCLSCGQTNLQPVTDERLREAMRGG